MTTSVPVIEPPTSAAAIFGDRLALAVRYADWLVGPAVERGLVGPREAERVWQRHIVNCAAAGALIAPGSLVVDLGSGAGLPGVVLAIARADLRIVLVESMLRRTAFLDEVVADLELAGVVVRRERAEELMREQLRPDVVTARAVAPIERLANWAAPLLHGEGVLLALKGSGVADEVSAGWPALRQAGLSDAHLFGVAAAREGKSGSQASLVPGLRVVKQGYWDAGLPGFPFVFQAEDQMPEEDRLALVAALRRRPRGLSPGTRRGLG